MSAATQKQLIEILDRKREEATRRGLRYVSPKITAEIEKISCKRHELRNGLKDTMAQKILDAIKDLPIILQNSVSIRGSIGITNDGDHKAFMVEMPQVLIDLREEQEELEKELNDVRDEFISRYVSLKDRIITEGDTDEIVSLVLNFKPLERMP